jgi:3-oxoacyl-[acyl-carrier protein] reductase
VSAPPIAATVLVTGAGRGIGRALALDLAENTAAQLLLVSKTERVLETAEACNASRSGSAHGFVWNLARRDDEGRHVLEQLERAPGPLGVVHAAGVLGPTGPFWRNDVEAWWSALELNLGASVRLVHGVLPRMLGERAGRIVLFSGGGGAYGYPGFSSYATAKAALVRFTETLALELADQGPIVTIMAPGANETDLLAEVRSAGGEVRTTVDIEEPCRLVRRLLTEDTRGLHGRFVHVRDEWTPGSAAAWPEQMLKLRRVDER